MSEPRATTTGTGTGRAAASAPDLPPRRALAVAAAALWLPALLAFAFGPLTECGHCVRTYVGLLPVFPGLLGALPLCGALELEQAPWLWVVAGLASLALLAALARAARRARRRDVLVPLAALLAAAQALVLSHVLRA